MIYKVNVRCFTFNQSKYITDTLEGFCIQKTDFPYICSIVDDASTDGAQNLIRLFIENNFEIQSIQSEETDYANIIFARHVTNRNCFFAAVLLKENHYLNSAKKFDYISQWRAKCDYEALCEGDDYWIDCDKLQEQYNFLEYHKEFCLCYSDFLTVNENKDIVKNRYTERVCYSGYVFDNLLLANFIQTVTVFCRMRDLLIAEQMVTNRGARYDYGFYLEMSLMGKFYYINKKMSCYRVLSESASHSKSVKNEINFALECNRIKQIYYSLKYEGRSKLYLYIIRLKIITKITLKFYLKNFLSFKH